MNMGTWIGAIGTFLGALAGATLAGAFTLRAVKKQINYDRDMRLKDELNDILVVSTEFIAHITSNIKLSKRLVDVLKNRINKKEFGYKNKSDINSVWESVTESNREISEMPLQEIPYPHIKKYLTCKLQTDSLAVQLEYLHHGINPQNMEKNDKLFQDLINCITDLEQELESVKKYCKQKESELNSIVQK